MAYYHKNFIDIIDVNEFIDKNSITVTSLKYTGSFYHLVFIKNNN